MKIINQFQGQYRFLSNFWMLPEPIEFEGLEYPSVEHAYQASKTKDKKERKYISKIKKPGQTKRHAKKFKLTKTWEKNKVKLMKKLVLKKFQIPELKERLLNTGDMTLIEGNNWNDTFWGVCAGKGYNHLGKILMEVRSELRNANT